MPVRFDPVERQNGRVKKIMRPGDRGASIRMKIHLWAPGFAVFQGGIGAFSQSLAEGLRAIGHEVSLYSRYDSPGNWHGLTLWGAKRAPAKLQVAFFAAGLIKAAVCDHPDYIISTHLNFGPVARMVKRINRTRYALIVHGVDVHEDLSEARQNALRAADRSIAMSSWTRCRLFASVPGLDRQRAFVLPNTIDETRFTVGPKPEYLRWRYALKPDDKVILTVARLAAHEGYKGYDRVVQALSAVRAACGSVFYLVIGQGDDRALVKKMAHDFGVAHAVIFAGFVPDEEMADHFRLADVFAMPSTGEGFGITFLEALACGTPVLAGNRDGSRDAVDNGRLGYLVDPINVEHIRQGLICLLQQRGAPLWFDRQALHDAVVARFGRAAFHQQLKQLF